MKNQHTQSKRDHLPLLTCLLALLTWMGCGEPLPPEITAAYDQLPETINFNFHVKPILSDKCFACHGPDAANQKADLRLDTPDGAYAALKEQPDRFAIVPYKLSRSEVYHRITATDTALLMPPPESNLALSETEIATLSKWIRQGAPYEAHWSFLKPEKRSLPRIKNSDWVRNEIDHFVLARLEQEDLQPNDAADKRTLIRRLSFDLRGLPPSLEEIDAFLADTAPEAYERLVDRFLESPAYGERMAMDWMDVARYADSDGYLDDKHREFAPWRDWVIRAFNQNMSYEQFVTWQLAGDLLEDAPKEAILATAFNRLHRKNSEAGIVFEEFRQEYVADRTNTLGKAFLGLTMECARCHDHKYDPISQEDYYQTFAFFNSTHEMGTAVYGPGQTPGPAMLLTTEKQDSILDFLERSIRREATALAEHEVGKDPDFIAWVGRTDKLSAELARLEQQDLVAHLPFDRLQPVEPKFFLTDNTVRNTDKVKVKEGVSKPGMKGQALFFNNYTSLKIPDKIGWFDRTDAFSVSFGIYPDTIYPEVGVFYHCEDIRLGFKGYSMHLEDNHLKFIIAHSYPQNAIEVRSKEALPAGDWTQVTLTYDGSSRADGIRIYWNGKPIALNVEYDHLYKGILFEPNIHTYGFAGFQLGERNFIKTLRDGGMDELKIYARELSSLEVLYQSDPGSLTELLQLPGKKSQLEDHYRLHHDPATAQNRQALHRLQRQLNDSITPIPEIMVMGDLPEPRKTYIQERGLYSSPGPEVRAGVPDDILPFSEDWPRNRLGLTQWLFDPDHPLTARVFVNRIWQMHFGRGIVRTAEDFGNQGELPTHPELLDWLAVDFRENNWDIKALHRKIVLSATYQQSSSPTPEELERDPDNTLLARGPSYRLPAEMIRDNVLAASGLLVDRRGGSSVYPYQPDGLWDELTNKGWRYRYLQEPGDGLYRRSLYTVFKRTSPPPSMLIFDAPDRSACTVRRVATSTPLQALVLLNDPQYIEAARVLAENLRADTGPDPKSALALGFEHLTGRPPSAKEEAVLLSYYQLEQERFAESPEAAAAYLEIGELPAEANHDLAALATVMHSVMNTTDSYTLR
ncbi:DUF1553 domain-containing protein [Flavilitoribacter nigricans]|uniref:Cytochrome c domain-containing protein n=1 Tax=Flavilitoribacter nigricans (strain ATCC 23147 / DSM 23189 / NBRC 102662 / NCIMB 1420 / SS-2) TaxID=1122177 RepID=A0A2D0N2S0_FLAN2|nr:DUF1553 domain-containing protein [Flavilitoribacter nigricans]PHN02821.1 hypothetical protein CRP01_30030 [Flavilitoribacter nigricans DSM 23189 = NBRC 102662]